jgi:hypothetical protein
LYTGKIGFKLVLGFQVDVKGAQIEEGEVQILGRGIINISEKGSGVLVLRGHAQSLKKAFYPAMSVPAYDGRGNLVSNGIAEDGGMAGAKSD